MKKGYTAVEGLIVVAILAIIIAMVLGVGTYSGWLLKRGTTTQEQLLKK